MKKDFMLRVKMSETDKAMLSALCNHRDKDMSKVIRELVLKAYREIPVTEEQAN